MLRVKALESLLVEKGLVDPAAIDLLIDAYETKIGLRNGARVVAHAWVDPVFKQLSGTCLMLPLTVVIQDLPALSRDEGGLVFNEPREAHAFALAVRLSESGCFSWSEWTAMMLHQAISRCSVPLRAEGLSCHRHDPRSAAT